MSSRPSRALLIGGGLAVAAIIAAIVFAATRDGDTDAAPDTGSSTTEAGIPSTAVPATTEPDTTPSTTAETDTTDDTTDGATASDTTVAGGRTDTSATTTAPGGTTDTTEPNATTLPDDTTDTTMAPEPTGFRLLFQNTEIGESYGFVASQDDAGDQRSTTTLRCERLDAGLARGLCARTNRGAETTFEAVAFDADFNEGYRVGLAGPPSRVRVSPSGDLAAVTAFVTGHEYENDGFSTQTILIDLAEERVITDLEDGFEVRRDGATWSEIDFNFWGVTFTDDETFYATLATGGAYYLVEGEVSSRVMQIVHEGGQCPSISPDGSRLAYRTRVEVDGQPTVWKIAVLDLETSEVVILAEDRNVDDQPFWLDDARIAYGLADPESPAAPDTWSVAADGTGKPELFLESAWSLVMQPMP